MSKFWGLANRDRSTTSAKQQRRNRVMMMLLEYSNCTSELIIDIPMSAIVTDHCLFRNFYQMRINRLRNIEMAKRNAERLRNPASFPSVPKGDL